MNAARLKEVATAWRRRHGGTAARLAASAAAGPLLARALLPAGDPLAGTVAVLPLVAAGLDAIDRRCAELGGRTIPATVSRWHGALLGLWLLLALTRSGLGLALPEPTLIAGLVLLAVERLRWQLPRLRPLLGQQLPRRPSLLFLLLPFTLYLGLLPWSTSQRPPDGDEPYYLLISHSLVHDLDIELTNNYHQQDWRAFLNRPLEPQPGDPRGPGGEVYSRHNLLLPLLLAPGYALAGRHGALVTMAALTALLAWSALRLARHYAPDQPGPALLAWALLAGAPPLLVYSYQVWVEVPAALLVVLALDRILDLDRARALGPGQRPRWWLGLALPLLLLPLLKLRLMLVALPLVALAWRRLGGRRRPLAVLALSLGAVTAAILAFNQLRYGNPLKMHVAEELELYRFPLQQYAKGALGLGFDAAFGLFAAAPVWLLLVPAAVLGLARRSAWLRHLALVFLPYLLLVLPRSEWYGGWAPPFRYALVALPLLSLGLIPLLARRRQLGARLLLALLGAATLLLALLWTAVPGWTYNLAAGSNHLLDHLARLLQADVIRLFPSAVRPRLATWLWPPLCVLLAGLGWWWPRRRVRQAQAPVLAALALLLAAAAAIPVAARFLPTRVIELEDAHVYHRGGHLYPDRWAVARTHYHGGWVLRPRESVRAWVVPGGTQVWLVLHLQFIDNQGPPPLLEVRAGRRLLARWPSQRPGQWQQLELGPLPWPQQGQPLVLNLRSRRPGETRPASGLILDRVELRWLE